MSRAENPHCAAVSCLVAGSGDWKPEGSGRRTSGETVKSAGFSGILKWCPGEEKFRGLIQSLQMPPNPLFQALFS